MGRYAAWDYEEAAAHYQIYQIGGDEVLDDVSLVVVAPKSERMNEVMGEIVKLIDAAADLAISRNSEQKEG